MQILDSWVLNHQSMYMLKALMTMRSTLPDLHSVPAISLSEGKPTIILTGLNLKEKLLSAAEPAVCLRCYLNIF